LVTALSHRVALSVSSPSAERIRKTASGISTEALDNQIPTGLPWPLPCRGDSIVVNAHDAIMAVMWGDRIRTRIRETLSPQRRRHRDARGPVGAES
jgi:hypothetical protein